VDSAGEAARRRRWHGAWQGRPDTVARQLRLPVLHTRSSVSGSVYWTRGAVALLATLDPAEERAPHARVARGVGGGGGAGEPVNGVGISEPLQLRAC
jgi:hypothetical protein